MLEGLRRALVESYVGAISLGWMLAQIVTHFVGVFSAPVAAWVSQKTYRNITNSSGSAGFPFDAAFPELIRAFLLLLVWYVLIRWLYLKPLKIKSSDAASTAEAPLSAD
jgi:hypothetical protein